MTQTMSRATLLRGTAAGAGALVIGGVAIAAWPRPGRAAPSPEQDTTLLAMALTLEQAQAALYAAAIDAGALAADLLTFVETAAPQEDVHVTTLTALIGSGAAAVPAFDFTAAAADPALFGPLALKLENLAIGAYNANVAELTPKARAELGRVISVDARHAGWLRGIAGDLPAPQVVDAGIPADTVTQSLTEAGVTP